MKQTILTFVTRVNPDRISDLKKLLDEMGSDVEGNPYIPYLDLKLLHFSSFVLTYDPGYGAYLVFENNFDGNLDSYLEDLYVHAADGLHRFYSASRLPAASAADKDHLLSYLRAHVIHPNAYHIGNVGRSSFAHDTKCAPRWPGGFLDDVVRNGNIGTASSSEKWPDVCSQSATLAWAANVQPRQTRWNSITATQLAIAAVIALLLSPILIHLTIVWIGMLRWTEIHEPAPPELDVRSMSEDG